VPPGSVANEASHLKAETSIVLNEAHQAIAFGLKGRSDKYVKNEREQIQRKYYLFQWFKMLLRDIQNDNDNLMAKDHKGYEVPLVTVISEALRLMGEAALDKINSSSEVKYKKHDVNWVITVPAIWTPAASGFMRKAASQANLIPFLLSPNLTLVREPEAACLHLLQSIENKEVLNKISAGTELVILDCGGGTNDMTYMKIEQIEPKMLCSELRGASGGSAGASNIDKHFTNLLKNLFGIERFEKMKKISSIIEVMDQWEMFKTGFSGEESFSCFLFNLMNEYKALFPEDMLIGDLANLLEDYNIKHSSARLPVGISLQIPAEIVSTWFDSVVDTICSELKSDLDENECKGVSLVYLVGGFTANPYFFQKVNKFIRTAFYNRTFIVLRDPKPDLAIVLGAVLAQIRTGKDALVKDHVAPYCYGIVASTVYIPGTHNSSKVKTIKTGRVEKKFVEILVLFARKGESIPIDYITPSTDFFPVTEKETHINFELFSLDAPVAKNEIVYADNEGLKKYSTVKVKVDRTIPMGDRRMMVNVRFGMEIQVTVKNKNGSHIQDTQCTYYR
jgi:molecular chaperone DnaK (HSP70)